MVLQSQYTENAGRLLLLVHDRKYTCVWFRLLFGTICGFFVCFSAYSVDARYLPVTPVELPTEVQVAEAIRNDVACQIRLRRSMPLLDIPLPPRQKPRNRHPLASTSGTLDSRHSHETPSSGFSSSSGSPLSMEYSST